MKRTEARTTLEREAPEVRAGGRGESADALTPFRNTPLRDFLDDEQRLAFAEAVRRAPDRFPLSCPLFIAGEERETEKSIVSENPCEIEQVVARSARATPEDARRAVEAARAAYPAWSKTPPGERAEILLAIAGLLRRRRDDFAAFEVYESAKPWREADADVMEAIDFLEYYAREMLRLSEPLRLQPERQGETNDYLYRPMGVGVVIAPWNFPLAIPVGMTSAALVTGNTVVLKPAEQSPGVMQLWLRLALEAGLPPGVLQYLPGIGEEVGPVLVEHPDVKFIIFTGSREVGCEIVERASHVRPKQRGLKRVVAEMGGKNGIIVDESADLERAVSDIIYSAFGYAGQKCSACSRVIALQEVHDELLERLAAAAKEQIVGPAADPATNIPALIDRDARKRVERYHDLAAGLGRRVFLGDVGALAKRGHFAAPGIYADLDRFSEPMQKEIFGPLLGVCQARDFDEAVKIINGTEFALTGGLHSRTSEHIERARREILAGNLYINRPITGAIVGRQPFGGFRFSGVGSKAGGPDYLRQFLIPQSIAERTD